MLRPRFLTSSQVSDWPTSASATSLLIPARGNERAQAVNPTYGDDFNGHTLAAKWTRRNVVSGDEVWTGGWLKTTHDTTASRGYYQTAPASGDYTITCRFSVSTGGAHMIGPAAVSTSGNGYATILYNDGKMYCVSVSAWSYSSNPGSANYPMDAYHTGAPMTCQLRRFSSQWSGRVGWPTESPTGAASFYWTGWVTWADGFTPDYIGFLRILGGISMTTAVDYFDVTTL